MSFLARPFAALRAHPDFAGKVGAPPYDVMSRAEAKSMAADNPCSFLRVSRAEIGLPQTVGAYDEAVYQQAAANLRDFEHAGYLVREKSPSFYIYRISNETHSQTGIAFAASVEAYNANRIRKHELTRPTKEDDRVRQIEATNAETGPVLLAHKDDSSLAAAISDNTEGSPDLTSQVDGWQHDIWIVGDAGPSHRSSTPPAAALAVFSLTCSTNTSTVVVTVTRPEFGAV